MVLFIYLFIYSAVALGFYKEELADVQLPTQTSSQASRQLLSVLFLFHK